MRLRFHLHPESTKPTPQTGESFEEAYTLHRTNPSTVLASMFLVPRRGPLLPPLTLQKTQEVRTPEPKATATAS